MRSYLVDDIPEDKLTALAAALDATRSRGCP